MRWAAIRDGIEDFDLWSLVASGAREARERGLTVAEMDEVTQWVAHAPLHYVGLQGHSTDFGGAQAFRDLRAKIARVAVRLGEANLLSKPEHLTPPPPEMPWRRFLREE